MESFKLIRSYNTKKYSRSCCSKFRVTQSKIRLVRRTVSDRTAQMKFSVQQNRPRHLIRTNYHFWDVNYYSKSLRQNNINFKMKMSYIHNYSKMKSLVWLLREDLEPSWPDVFWRDRQIGSLRQDWGNIT